MSFVASRIRSKEEGSWIAAVSTGVVLGLTAILLWRRNKKKPFRVDYVHPPFPLSLRIVCSLPEYFRHPIFIAGCAPKPPFDGIDLQQGGAEYDPFEIKELEPNKIWRVRYRFVPDPALGEAMAVLFGVDVTDRSLLEHIDDVNIRKNVEYHMDKADELATKNQGLKNVKQKQLNMFLAGYEDSQDMLIARLRGANKGDENCDDLLLYNPCRMRPKVIEFLKSLGTTVRYIVSGSSAHTNQLPQAAGLFPDAKIICSKAAELKCCSVKMRKADFVYTDHKDDSPHGYAAAQRELKSRYNGTVQLFHVQGDKFTENMLITVHNHLFETDLSYGNGQRVLHVDDDHWKRRSEDPYISTVLRFYYAAMHNSSIAGYLPDYRLMGMDPASPFGKMTLNAPPDETSCDCMAASLRKLLNLSSYQFVDNVHSKKQNSLPAAEFKECVDRAWNWLDDGKSLLQ